MRVLLVTDWTANEGGIEAYVMRASHALQAAGHEVRLLTSSMGSAARGVADYVAFGTDNPAAQSLLQIVNPFAECEIMHNNALINGNMVHAAAALGVPRYFFSSSVCIYRDMAPGEAELTEDDAYPAQPDNEYGWEKLYAERLALAYARRYGIAVRIARFQNCYGPDGTWTGGREKAPAAICRKIAEADDGGTIEVWGDGSAIRSYTYVDDMVDGVYRLMQSQLEGPVNIGSPEYVTVAELVDVIAREAGKRVAAHYVSGPVGVRSRNFSNARVDSLGWQARFSLEAGIGRTYPWIAEQVRRHRAEQRLPHAAPTQPAVR